MRFALVWLLACIGLLAGCAGWPLRDPPSVTVADIQLARLGVLEQTLVLRLRVQNPNDSEFEVDGLAYTLEINGRPFARGVGNKAVRVPRYGVAVIETEAVSGMVDLARQFEDFRRGSAGALRYRLYGHLSAGAIGRLPFDYVGELSLGSF